MWARLDDELLDHRKILSPAPRSGRTAPRSRSGFYAVGLMWGNKHLTDGHLPLAVVKSFRMSTTRSPSLTRS